MTKRIPDGLDPDFFAELGAGFMGAKMLCVASDLGLFEKLADGPLDADALAAAMGVPARAVRVLAGCMVAMKVLELDGGRYRNGRHAQEFLTGRGALDERPGLRLYDRIVYPMWMQLGEVAKSGQPAKHAQRSEEFARIFSEGVEAWTMGAALALADGYDFGRHAALLDVAGGTGSYLVPALERHPSLRASLFDLPPTIAIAEKKLARSPVRDRVTLVEGDVFFDPLPNGHDVILIAGFAHLFDPDKVRLAFRRAREAAAPGARLIVVDQWMDASKTSPRFATMLAGTYLMLSGEGGTWSVDEGRGWLGETGWRFLEHRPLVGVTSAVIAEAA